jgi:hypothetical protein
MRTEVVLVPTYKRPEMLFHCLALIRAFEPQIPISVFPDRGTLDDPELRDPIEAFSDNVQWNWVAPHDYPGNTMNVMEAYRWAYNETFDLTYLIEDDVMIHPDFFKWHREQHDDEDSHEIFASMAWIFNRHAPIVEMDMRQAWYYSIGTCFARDKLRLIVEHATSNYYGDMTGYLAKHFKTSPLNDPLNIQHFEQDGLIQRIIDQEKSQTVSPGIAKCTHLGFYGYNRGWSCDKEIYEGCSTFTERLSRLTKFLDDPYWRATVFGRAIVEREIGKALPKREFIYQVTLPNGFETTFVSELQQAQLPKRIHSVTLPEGTVITQIEKSSSMSAGSVVE